MSRSMNKPTRFVGLDVHAKTATIAIAEGRDPARFVGEFPHDRARILKALDRLGSRESLLWPLTA